jgi:acyl-CoA reductase-like NAD-dependent aldehyde dehydrogenase
MMKLNNYISGTWSDATDHKTINTFNPANGELVSELPAGSAQDADKAVKSALNAQPNWSAVSLRDRVDLLLKFADLIEAHAAELVAIEAEEMGKPVGIGDSFLDNGLKTYRDSVMDAMSYSFVEVLKVEEGVETSVLRKPLGVVAVIVPWNFTATTVLQGICSFLAAGNSVVLKPSEKSSASAVRMFEIFDSLDFPPGTMNLLLGDARAGEPLVANPKVSFVHFTGSVPTGRAIATTAGSKLHRSALELGGKDATVVDRDVDVHFVAREVAAGSFLNSGQICTSMERVYIHRAIRQKFIEALSLEASAYTVGDPLNPTSQIGPMVDSEQKAIVREHLDDAIRLGAEVVYQGSVPSLDGHYFPPTVITDVNQDMKIMSNETFGPIVAIQFVESFQDGLDCAKQTDFGLAATVYSNNTLNIEAAKNQLDVGILWINKWQGGDLGRMIEPARDSGSGAMGGRLSYDSATRPQAVHSPVQTAD